MSLRLFMDEHVKSAVTEGLRQRGYDVLTAQGTAAMGFPISNNWTGPRSSGEYLSVKTKTFWQKERGDRQPGPTSRASFTAIS